MSWPDAMGLIRHWNDYPPAHEILKVWLGIKTGTPNGGDAEADAMANKVSSAEFQALLAKHGLPTS